MGFILYEMECYIWIGYFNLKFIQLKFLLFFRCEHEKLKIVSVWNNGVAALERVAVEVFGRQ